MTVKSNFELDDRINSIDDIQTIIHNDHGFIGCEGYFFDKFVQTKDLTKCDYGTLVDINGESVDHCFKARDENGNERIGYYRFFIPEKLLKPLEKKYRPYTLAEWVDQHEIGEVIRFRNTCNQEFNVMYLGYILDTNDDIQDIRTKGQIMFVSTPYTLQELFERYEICINGEWKPFGMEE
ncbi:hypothetical protein [Methanobrevibacter sp.]|uniref:hypothetical protein n=1 Tax=Methanobrevibacter sp. TaxID=66852 RepID=UPI00386FBE5A